MNKSMLIAATTLGVSLALAGCNNADNNRTTSIPRGADQTALVKGEPTGLSASPAPAERGPFVPDAGAPGAQSPAAFTADTKPPAGSAGSDEATQVRAEEAAVRAPDTAAGDAAKRAVLTEGAKGDGAAPSAPTATARDTAANAPRTRALTPEEESTQMPKAGQANNHSSTSLEKDSGR